MTTKKNLTCLLSAAALFLLLINVNGADTVKIGFSKIDITPDATALQVGIRTQGWGGAKPSHTLNLPLFVRTLAMKDARGQLLVIVTTDTCKYNPIEYFELQDWFEKKYHTSKWRMIINASHTHQAPNWYLPRKKKFSDAVHKYISEYQKIIVKATQKSIEQAVAEIKTPMTIQFANLQISKDMTYNKIHSINKGKLKELFPHVELDLGVMAFFDTKTRKIAALLWSISSHPTNTFIEKAPDISSNIIGYGEMALQKTFGRDVKIFFTQGAAGEMRVRYPDLTATRKRIPGSRPRKYQYFDEDGKELSAEQFRNEYRHAMSLYGQRIANIIKAGFTQNKFQTIDNIEFKVAGVMKTVLANSTKANAKGLVRRQDAERKLQDKTLNEEESYAARVTLLTVDDQGRRVNPIIFSRISFNKNFQIVTMSKEVCSIIGRQIKDYYLRQQVKTLFLGYTPWGDYYPDNKIARYRIKTSKGSRRLYWAGTSQLADFDFEKFALDSVKSLRPK